MNYITHLNAVLNHFINDLNINPTHISLYMVLFREWNTKGFPQSITIKRAPVMKAAKIGSKSTYHRCINDLHNSGYIIYNPSRNPHKGSVVQMANFETDRVPKAGHRKPGDVFKMEPYNPGSVPVTINKHENDKYKGRPLNEHEVINFFTEKGKSQGQAIRFFRHYEMNNWMTGRKEPVYDWKSIAQLWIKNYNWRGERKYNRTQEDHLKTSKNKNYDEPL